MRLTISIGMYILAGVAPLACGSEPSARAFGAEEDGLEGEKASALESDRYYPRGMSPLSWGLWARDFVYDANSLSASLEPGYGGSYWPSNLGGPSWRWQEEDSDAFGYEPVNYATAADHANSDFALLSPAEKFAILRGDRDNALVDRVRARDRPNAPEWFGYCNGWTKASLWHQEPNPVTAYRTPDGRVGCGVGSPSDVALEFGSSDIKALLAYYYDAVVPWGAIDGNFMGECTGSSFENCTPLNPAPFHLVLLHQLVRKQTRVALDTSPGAEKWNSPVHGMHAEQIDVEDAVLASFPGSGEAARRVVVINDVNHTTNVEPSVDVMRASKDHLTTTQYCYILELDSQDRVFNGVWIHHGAPGYELLEGDERFDDCSMPPDYMFAKDSAAPFTFSSGGRSWSLLGELLECAYE